MAEIETIAQGRFLGLYQRGRWEFVERPNADGVVGILPLTARDEIVLVEQLRVPLQARVIEIPAGLIGDEDEHRGEGHRETAQRELLEETGYRAGRLELLLSSPTSSGMTPEITHLFLATELSREHEGGGVGNENLVVHHVPRTGLRDWFAERQAEGFLIDFKIHAALWLAGLHDE